jgi:CelD/BcsL family acetyltransferase involved in cellulose biosynthesis
LWFSPKSITAEKGIRQRPPIIQVRNGQKLINRRAAVSSTAEQYIMVRFQLRGRMRGALRTLVPAGLKIANSNGPDFKPLCLGGLNAQCHRDWPNDPQFIRQWNALLARNPHSTVFCSPVWQSEVVTEFVRADRFRLITVHRQSELLAVLPLAFKNRSILVTPGESVSDFITPLVDPSAATEVWSIMLALLDDLWDWSVGGMVLQNVQGDSGIREVLPLTAAHMGWDYREEIATQALYIPLPSGWEEYLSRLDSHDRKEIRRKIRNAQNNGRARWQTISDESEVAPALERALAQMLHAEPTKADFTKRVLVRYLRRVSPLLAREGNFFIKQLSIEDKPCAWLLGMQSSRGPMIYNTSYDASMRQWSPGIVSFSLAIQDAIAAGHPVFNLLRGGAEYKRRFGAVDLQLYTIMLHPKRNTIFRIGESMKLLPKVGHARAAATPPYNPTTNNRDLKNNSAA